METAACGNCNLWTLLGVKTVACGNCWMWKLKPVETVTIITCWPLLLYSDRPCMAGVQAGVGPWDAAVGFMLPKSRRAMGLEEGSGPLLRGAAATAGGSVDGA